MTAARKVDLGILTIRDDEFRAVLAALPDEAGILQSANREYTLRHADIVTGERYLVAVLRQAEQGNGEAQSAASDLIRDLSPRLVLVVGIAGGLPSDDITLGDVVISTRIHDFTVEARRAGRKTTYAAAGGPITRTLAAKVANLAARERDMGDWTADLGKRAKVRWTRAGDLYGPKPWQAELRDKLDLHHRKDPDRSPRYYAGAIASSDRLVKDPTLLFPWITTARNILAIEMESGGVFRAASERCPMLAIRGISDLVGLKRADAWTKFACASAAAFTRAFLRTRPVVPRVARIAPRVARIAASRAHGGRTASKHTILFLAANPSGTDRLALDREARAIQIELERSGHRDQFVFETRWAAEPLDLLRELRKLKPTIVHFAGHGGQHVAVNPDRAAKRDVVRPTQDAVGTAGQPEGLAFQDSDGHSQFVSASALRETFGAAGASVKLVVLNACYSALQATALLAHVDCVVGMRGSLRDDAARNFAIGFYGGLGDGEPIAGAFKQGRAAMSLGGLSQRDGPQLRVRRGIEASRLIVDPQ